MYKQFMSQKGIIYLPVLLVAIVGVLAFLVISSNAPLRDQLLNSLYPKSKSHAAAPWDGVPSINIDYNQDVETYWANHPFNPSSPNYRPDINSPSNQVNVATQFGGNTQAALDSLPSSGGTLYFPAGDYSKFILFFKKNFFFFFKKKFFFFVVIGGFIVGERENLTLVLQKKVKFFFSKKSKLEIISC